MEWVDNYIGIPYIPAGRDHSGCDCYGLVKLIYSEVFSVELPDLSDRYNVVNEKVVDIYHEQIKNWKEVGLPIIGDVVYFRLAGHEMHVGVYIGDNEFLHNLSGSGTSSIANLTHNKWKQRLIGFWRYDKS